MRELPAPAPNMICVNDGSGVFWRVNGVRTVEQATRFGAWPVAEYLFGPNVTVVRHHARKRV